MNSPLVPSVRAAAVVLRGNSVLLHRRNGDAVWALPGGRVQHGEVAAEALVRELREELAEPIKCEHLLWVVENVFVHEGQRNHELGLYFLSSLAPGSPLLASDGPFLGVEQHAQLTFAWFQRAGLHGVNIRPPFLARSLAERELKFAHVVHREQHAL